MTIEVRSDPSDRSVAAFLGIGVDELVERDRFQRPTGRWLARDRGIPTGLATASVRPDDRLFVTHRLHDEMAFGPLLHAVARTATRPIHLSIGHDQLARLRTAERAGFVPVLTSVAFDVPFHEAIRRTAGPRSDRVDTVPADRVPADQLFALDTDLRQDVPGSDGWRGDRTWFDDEMASAEFDPTGYLVARDRTGGDLVGLCRFWRNEAGPALGLIGVRTGYRNGRVASVLLHETMRAASRWGFGAFSTHTARPSLQRRLRSVGARPTGGFTQFLLVS